MPNLDESKWENVFLFFSLLVHGWTECGRKESSPEFFLSKLQMNVAKNHMQTLGENFLLYYGNISPRLIKTQQQISHKYPTK